jgi:isocitrate/isopropylmalate dehydrogenase
MLLGAVMMLEYLGMEKATSRLEKAIFKVYEEGKYLTRDQGGTASTTRFCEAVKANL